MSKKTFRIISAVTTAVAAATVAILQILEVPNCALWQSVTVTVSGLIDEICTIFINDGNELPKA